jgi:hypothetical protein
LASSTSQAALSSRAAFLYNNLSKEDLIMTEEVKALLAQAGLSDRTKLYVLIQPDPEQPTHTALKVESWGREGNHLKAQVWSLQWPMHKTIKPLTLRYLPEQELFELSYTVIPNRDKPETVKYVGRLFEADSQGRSEKASQRNIQ